jgi:hypothetical protein
MARTSHRRRREVSPRFISVTRLLLRYSLTRDAYVLRGVGNRFGPVLKVHRASQNSERPAEAGRS